MTDETVVRQVLDGMALPHDDLRCSHGYHPLREGARVTACARRLYGTERWEISECYCPEHAPDDPLEAPHGETVLAHARVGMLADVAEQTHEPALLDVRIVDCVLDGGRVEA